MSTEFNRGLQVAIDSINKEADALAEDFGTVDPDTGALEFGRGQRELSTRNLQRPEITS